MTDQGTANHQGNAAIGAAQSHHVGKVPAVLKGFVITSGIMLILGAILLAVLIVLKAQKPDGGEASLPAGPVDLAMPAGTRVSQVIADGRHLVLLAESQDGQQYIAVVDRASGARQSLIRIAPAP